MLAKLLIKTDRSTVWVAVTDPRYVHDPDHAFAAEVAHHKAMCPNSRFHVATGEQASSDWQ